MTPSSPESENAAVPSLAASAFIFNSGYARLPVEGTSMLPLLKAGSRVTIRQLSNDETIREGEIYAFVKSGNIVLHRVARKDNCIYIAIGDNALRPEHINRGDIIGILDSSLPLWIRIMIRSIDRTLFHPRYFFLMRLRRKAYRYILRLTAR